MECYSRLKMLRLQVKLTQCDLAGILAMSQVGYGMYELGKRRIPLEKLIQLAKLYHTSLDYLVGLTDDSRPSPAPKIKDINKG